MDPVEQHREAFLHATSGDWRLWPRFVDSILDDALAAMRAELVDA